MPKRKSRRNSTKASGGGGNWVTINGTPVLIGEDGKPKGKIGKKISATSKKKAPKKKAAKKPPALSEEDRTKNVRAIQKAMGKGKKKPVKQQPRKSYAGTRARDLATKFEPGSAERKRYESIAKQQEKAAKKKASKKVSKKVSGASAAPKATRFQPDGDGRITHRLVSGSPYRPGDGSYNDTGTLMEMAMLSNAKNGAKFLQTLAEDLEDANVHSMAGHVYSAAKKMRNGNTAGAQKDMIKVKKLGLKRGDMDLAMGDDGPNPFMRDYLMGKTTLKQAQRENARAIRASIDASRARTAKLRKNDNVSRLAANLDLGLRNIPNPDDHKGWRRLRADAEGDKETLKMLTGLRKDVRTALGEASKKKTARKK